MQASNDRKESHPQNGARPREITTLELWGQREKHGDQMRKDKVSKDTAHENKRNLF